MGSLSALGLGLGDYLRLGASQAERVPDRACIMIVLDGARRSTRHST